MDEIEILEVYGCPTSWEAANIGAKYSTWPRWLERCGLCGMWVEMEAAKWEVLGAYCEGCFGYPVCSCFKCHTGDCPRPLAQRIESG